MRKFIKVRRGDASTAAAVRYSVTYLLS